MWSIIKTESRRHITTGLKCTLTAGSSVFFLLLQSHTSPYRSCLPISHSWMHMFHGSVPFMLLSRLLVHQQPEYSLSYTQSGKGCWEIMLKCGMCVFMQVKFHAFKCLNDHVRAVVHVIAPTQQEDDGVLWVNRATELFITLSFLRDLDIFPSGNSWCYGHVYKNGWSSQLSHAAHWSLLKQANYLMG